MKHEYREGPEARKKFDEGMTKLFRVPKSTVTEEKPKPKPKRKKASKG
jgi:pyruvate/2-oxoacid:ferredoxin oxidoreductase beta subunit